MYKELVEIKAGKVTMKQGESEPSGWGPSHQKKTIASSITPDVGNIPYPPTNASLFVFPPLKFFLLLLQF